MTEDTVSERPKRLSLSQIVELLLTRATPERSSVTLSRNASGETQIEVSVRTGDNGGVVTAEDAEREALAIYDRLIVLYPTRAGHEAADVSLTRNAKGETQIGVSIKTSDDGFATLAEAEAEARKVYDATRMKYPMADGFTAKPGSVS